MDNFFSGDKVLPYLGEGGWKRTITCRHNCLPKSIPRKYFNFIKVAPVNARSKVAQFEQPIQSLLLNMSSIRTVTEWQSCDCTYVQQNLELELAPRNRVACPHKGKSANLSAVDLLILIDFWAPESTDQQINKFGHFVSPQELSICPSVDLLIFKSDFYDFWK